jgi:adenylate cyclase
MHRVGEERPLLPDRARGPRMRRPIVLRLLAAFLLVSLLPIGVLAYLSWRESRGPDVHVEGEAGAEPSGEELFGIPTATIELMVAGISLALAGAMALYISRTLVRPIRELESSMTRVEAGDLEARAEVRSDDELGRLAGSFNRMVEGVRREKFITDLFGQYVTPELAHVAIEHQGQLDGQLVTSTIIFSDIRDFTGVSEALPASNLIEMLNRYFSRMAAIVVENGGLVNKYGGDSLLAVFGTPLNPTPDHAARAVRSAIAMTKALGDFNREQTDTYLPEIMIGIGIATGDVVAGNVGSEKKLEYTVLGDAVNVASRLQAMTKEVGHTVLANAETARAAPEAARFEDVGEVEVRGRVKKTRVFAVQTEVRVANLD